MNNPSPLVPQGSNLEQKNLGRTRVRVAVFFIISVHVVGLMALLLMPGCRKTEPEATGDLNQGVAPAIDVTNAAIEPEPVGTNTVLTPVQPVVDPALTAPPPVPVAPAVQEYVIARGDNYTTIGRQFGVTPKAIADANPGIDPTRLQIGQKIVIPAPSAIAAPAAVADASAGTVHTVKSGENLTIIAAKYQTTVKALRAENNLTSDRIIVGQKLKIPAPAAAPAPAQ